MCVEIALDAKRLVEEGKGLRQVRQIIEDTYNNTGSTTDTPWPVQ
jgi:hypothetical protein